MPPPSKKPSLESGGGEQGLLRRSDLTSAGDDSDLPSVNLWVGNLGSDTTESDLMGIFAKYGALESVSTYTLRNYAFVNFKHLDDAKAAKEALQGAYVRGSSVKIQYARPGKPVKQLWVGCISSSVTKEQLEDEFRKYGKIEDIKLVRDRNSALVEYYKIDDAVAALKNLNGKRLWGEQLRVDYLRSQPSRRSGGRKSDGQPSKVLWVGYPPSIQIDEQMLHNAMILFGEIERIKSFPNRHYSFVEFRSIDEARRAKEGLQGRLFNDPRITIMFSSSEIGPIKDNPSFYPGIRGPRPDMFFNESPYGHMDIFGPNQVMAPNPFSGPHGPNNMSGPNMPIRPFGPQGFDPGAGDMFNDMGPNWRRLSPGPGMLPSPGPGMRPSIRPTWDGLDSRESKRSRIDGPPTHDDSPFPGRRLDNQGIIDPYGVHPPDRSSPGSLANFHSQGRQSPIGVPKGPTAGFSSHVEQHEPHDVEYCWRGVIAKGGSPVCRARCIAVGKGVDSPLPDVVNCSARTGLDMLTKHYADAIGFDMVYFLPDSEDDFASYTEFLRYLCLKDRAGVAKFDDGTTLFLVPPSDFLTDVLKVSGPERLYGVVLKLPHQPTSAPVQQQSQLIPPQPSQYIERFQPPHSQPPGYSLASQGEDQGLHMDYQRASQDNTISHLEHGNALLNHSDDARTLQSIPPSHPSNPPATSQAEVSLTPELLATLASMLPGNMQPSATSAAQLPISSSTRLTSLPAYGMPDKVMAPPGWRQEDQVVVSGAIHQVPIQQPHQMGHPFNNQDAHNLGYQFNLPNRPEHSGAVIVSTQNLDPALNVQQASTIPSRSSINPVISQGGQFAAPQPSPQYQLDSSLGSQKNYPVPHATDTAVGLFHSAGLQQPPNHATSQTQIGNITQPQMPLPSGTDKLKPDISNQMQQLQTALASSVQGSSEEELNKNQRYQSTLQFAASLLLQIQQQQQANAQTAQGSGNQQ
ncbi:Flowering time control protein FPA [Acorus gramineus]|uniref:Flowering time control protein FPA n=1 Tax=Acorus gramineus TaxID=55184 RepID=A0AAV9B1Z8_ACOGR|nr:Flowering time control protein FPA [Acorus gramineus]